MQNTDLNLVREAEHLYRSLFNCEIPAGLVGGYVDVHRSLAKEWHPTPAEERTLHLIVELSLDAAALEPWLRRKGSLHIVSVKLLLLAYLDECAAGRSGVLRNTWSGRAELARGIS